MSRRVAMTNYDDYSRITRDTLPGGLFLGIDDVDVQRLGKTNGELI
jgi:hypothetical protein